MEVKEEGEGEKEREERERAPDEARKSEGMEEVVGVDSNAMKETFTFSPAMMNRAEEEEDEEEEEERGETSLRMIEVCECD